MGIESLLQQNLQSSGLAGVDRLARNAMFPQSQMDKTQYATPSQMPTSAETIRSDYDAPTNAYTGLPTQPFAAGGIASIPRFNGEDGSGVDVSGNTGWDPEKGAVKLQKLSDPNDPFSDVTTVDYSIPKDTIKQFIPDIDSETNTGLGSGQYILNDGSTMRVDSSGIVQSATPGRDEYTLNKEGYYQPTGSGLTWRGDQNMLYKKIGGVDVNVPGIYHKGGYQDAQGNLAVDANGVPVALAPNYLDSGFGESGLSDAAPYITALAMTAMGMPTGAMAFEGMVPASETLMGSLGAGATTSGGIGLNASQVPNLGASLGATGGTTAGTGAGWGSLTAASNGGVGIGAGALGTGVPASLAMPTTGALAGGTGATSAGLTAKQAYAAKMGLDLLSGGANQSGTGGYAPQTAVASAPATVPTIERRGVTGYYGASEAPDYRTISYRPYASKIHGAPGEFSFADGGITTLGGYSDGGRLLKGPGDGMSDNIPATIADKQPARLADGEFVIPADVVSHLGNGSTDAGAKQLYAMMDKIRKARTGTKKQGKQINPAKFLP